MFDKAESEYKELSGRKQIVLNDRHKIEQVIWDAALCVARHAYLCKGDEHAGGKTHVCAAARAHAVARLGKQRPVPVQQCRCSSSLPQCGRLQGACLLCSTLHVMAALTCR